MKSKKPAKTPLHPLIAVRRRFLVSMGREADATVTDNDRTAAELATKYDEGTLRKAVTMSAAAARESWRKDQQAGKVTA